MYDTCKKQDRDRDSNGEEKGEASHPIELLYMARHDPILVFGEYKLDQRLFDCIIANINHRLQIKPVKVKAVIEAICFGYIGVEAVRNALIKAEEEDAMERKKENEKRKEELKLKLEASNSDNSDNKVKTEGDASQQQINQNNDTENNNNKDNNDDGDHPEGDGKKKKKKKKHEVKVTKKDEEDDLHVHLSIQACPLFSITSLSLNKDRSVAAVERVISLIRASLIPSGGDMRVVQPPTINFG